jgi:hypothetical protein
MYPKTKSTLFSRHTLSLILAFGLVALVAGVYFLFKPFPAGPSLEVKANKLDVSAGKVAASVAGSYANHTLGLQEAASVAGWSAYANASVRVSSAASMPSSVREFASSQQRNFGPASVSSAASMPSSVREFASSQQRNFAPASVAGWSAYANAPVVVKEAASVVGWSAYANPPTIVKSDDVQKPQNPKSPESLRRR